MTVEQEAEYAKSMGAAYEKDTKGKPRTNKASYYKTYWRTFQMSDHLPMWVEVLIDHTDSYMKHKLVPDQKEDG